MSGANRGDDRGGACRPCRHRGPRKRKRASDDEHWHLERTAEAVGGPEHESGEDTGAREGRHTDRRQGCTFLKTAVGGHFARADTAVSLTAEEERLPSSEEEVEDDDNGQPKGKRRKVLQEQRDTPEVANEANPAGCSSKCETSPEESRKRA